MDLGKPIPKRVELAMAEQYAQQLRDEAGLRAS